MTYSHDLDVILNYIPKGTMRLPGRQLFNPMVWDHRKTLSERIWLKHIKAMPNGLHNFWTIMFLLIWRAPWHLFMEEPWISDRECPFHGAACSVTLLQSCYDACDLYGFCQLFHIHKPWLRQNKQVVCTILWHANIENARRPGGQYDVKKSNYGLKLMRCSIVIFNFRIGQWLR